MFPDRFTERIQSKRSARNVGSAAMRSIFTPRRWVSISPSPVRSRSGVSSVFALARQMGQARLQRSVIRTMKSRCGYSSLFTEK